MKQKFLFALVAVLLIGMTACNKDSRVRFSNADISLYYDQIKYLNTNLRAAKVKVETNNNQVAVAESQSNIDINMIVVKAVSVGNAVIKGQWNNTVDSCRVKVEPRSDMFAAPVCFRHWGESKSAIQSLEKRTLLEETETSLKYKGDNAKVSSVIYYFENDALKRVVVQLAVKAATDVNLKHYLFERYLYMNKESNTYYFEDRYDHRTRIVMKVSQEYGIQVGYTDDANLGVGDLFSGSTAIVIDDPNARETFYNNLNTFCKDVEALIP